MLYVGVDQHARHLTVTVRDEQGEVRWTRSVSTRPQKVRSFWEQVSKSAEADGGYVVVLEVCGFNQWLVKLLGSCGCRQVILVQPEKRKSQKTDKRDAIQLSELLWSNRSRLSSGERMGNLRCVEIPSEADEKARQITALRHRLGGERTRTICRIKHILRRHNLQHYCPTKGIQTNKARAWLEQLELDDVDRLELDGLLEQWDLISKQLDRVNAKIKTLAATHDKASGLRSLPGAGAYTRLAVGSRVGTLDRFKRPGSLSNYWGIAPSVRNSGEVTGRIGSITKQGSSLVRFLLGQLTTHVLREDRSMRRWYLRIKRRRGAKIGRVAVMRRLSRIIWHMLGKNQPYGCVGVPAQPTSP